MVMSQDYLLPEIRALLDLDKSERIQYLEKDIWIGYARATKAVMKLQELYQHPTRRRMPNLLIIGPTNNGKTMIIEKFYRLHLPKRGDDSVGNKNALQELPVLLTQMPSSPDIKRVFLSIIEKLSGPIYYASSSLSSIERALSKEFERFKVKMIIIDEIHNMLAGSNRQQLEFLNLLRYIGNEFRIPLVCVGTKDAYLAIRSDPQLENRFEPFPIPIWTADGEYASLLASFVSIFPLKNRSNLNSPAISEFILNKSEGIIGEMITLLRRAAISAIYSGAEEITEITLRMADYHSPLERKKMFERELI